MKPYYQTSDVTLWNGDCREVLRSLPDGSVNCVVTSPPYWGLRDYRVDGQIGLEESFDEWIVIMVEVFEEIRRALATDGTVWLNIGDAYNAYNGGAGPSSRLSKGAQTKARPQLPSGYGLRTKSLKPKDLIGMPWMLAFALRSAGWYLRQDIIWHKPNPMPESITDRCTRAHEYIFMFTKSRRYHYDADAIRTQFSPETKQQSFDTMDFDRRNIYGDGSSSSHKPRSVKMPDGWATHEGGHGSIHRNGREKGKKQDGHGRRHAGFNERYDAKEDRQRRGYEAKAASQANNSGANKRSVWTIATEGYPGAHFATYPTDLVKPCILAGCPTGGTVLDPFAGSGTTLQVARELGCKSIGIELNRDYCELVRKRMDNVTPSIFAGANA